MGRRTGSISFFVSFCYFCLWGDYAAAMRLRGSPTHVCVGLCGGASFLLFPVGGRHLSFSFHVFTCRFDRGVRGRPACGLLGTLGAPRSLQQLAPRRLPTMYSRLERSVVGRISYGPNRFTTDLKIIRLAITLRCMFGAPCSHVI